jgi:hypothetical protein
LRLKDSDARYETDDSTGVGAARKAARTGPVYVLDQEFDQKKVDYFQQAGFDVVQIEDDLYELVPLQHRQ